MSSLGMTLIYKSNLIFWIVACIICFICTSKNIQSIIQGKNGCYFLKLSLTSKISLCIHKSINHRQQKMSFQSQLFKKKTEQSQIIKNRIKKTPCTLIPYHCDNLVYFDSISTVKQIIMINLLLNVYFSLGFVQLKTISKASNLFCEVEFVDFKQSNICF